MPCPHNEISIVQRLSLIHIFLIELLGADHAPGVLIKIRLYHPGFEMCIRDRYNALGQETSRLVSGSVYSSWEY